SASPVLTGMWASLPGGWFGVGRNGWFGVGRTVRFGTGRTARFGTGPVGCLGVVIGRWAGIDGGLMQPADLGCQAGEFLLESARRVGPGQPAEVDDGVACCVGARAH